MTVLLLINQNFLISLVSFLFIEYKWSDLGLNLKLEDFSDYEAVTSIIKITKGNFRLLQQLFAQICQILEIYELNTITIDVVEAARDSIVIGL